MAHILIVEDEAPIRLLVRIMLKSAGHSVYEAWDGGAALDILETYPEPFDMILLDLLMPKTNGFEFLSKLQTQPYRPPVVILSAHLDRVPQAFKSMVRGHLLKPFRSQELKDIVNSLLGESTLTQQMRAENVAEHNLYAAGDD